jgi:hypothetical protein
MKSADRRVRSRDVGGESSGIEYPAWCAKEFARLVQPRTKPGEKSIMKSPMNMLSLFASIALLTLDIRVTYGGKDHELGHDDSRTVRGDNGQETGVGCIAARGPPARNIGGDQHGVWRHKRGHRAVARHSRRARTPCSRRPDNQILEVN